MLSYKGYYKGFLPRLCRFQLSGLCLMITMSQDMAFYDIEAESNSATCDVEAKMSVLSGLSFRFRVWVLL